MVFQALLPKAKSSERRLLGFHPKKLAASVHLNSKMKQAKHVSGHAPRHPSQRPSGAAGTPLGG